MEALHKLNHRLEKFLNTNRSPEFIEKEIRKILLTDLLKRINPLLREKIKIRFPSLINMLDSTSFKSIKSEIGKTYCLFVDETKSEGACLLLKINYNKNQNNESKFVGSAECFREEFNQTFDYVSRLITEKLKEAYFSPGIIRNLEIKFLNQFNDEIKDIKLYGESIKFPFAVAIFSTLFNLEIDTSIACSGNITEDLRITYVDGMEEKISAAVLEYPEIKTFIFPEDCKKLNLETKFPDLKIIYVNTLEEGLKAFFNDFDNLIQEKDFIGKTKIKNGEVILENDDRAILIELDFDFNVFTLHSDTLTTFQRLVSDIHKKWEKTHSIFLLINEDVHQ